MYPAKEITVNAHDMFRNIGQRVGAPLYQIFSGRTEKFWREQYIPMEAKPISSQKQKKRE